MNLISLAVICLAGLGVSDPQALPDELAHLKALAGDENRLVEAVRTYDREQTALAKADLEAVAQHLAAGEQDKAKEKKEQAQGRFQHIRAGYEFAVHHYPNNARAQTFYGEVLYDRFGEQASAIRAWELAIALDPKLSEPHNDLGIHYCHIGEVARGLRYYDEALKLDPKNPDYLFNLAQTYLTYVPDVQKCRQWDKPKVYREAMKLSKKATHIDAADYALAQDYAANFFMAENFAVPANWKEAAKAWQAARTIARNDIERFQTWLNEARSWIRAKDKAQARTCLEEALKLQPESAVVKQLLSNLGQEDNSPKRRP